MIGQTLSHYQILEKLGEGGMGVVYKARDNHLDRLVAIKVLPAVKVADPDRKRRFVQEAKAASALNHPNIITIYDIGEAGGVDFIAMEYIAGKPLDHLIPHKGLPLTAALKYAVQVADALAGAHGVGIVHRDLKPGNVMVTENGLVKVLDFGLAKLADQAAASEPDGATILAPSRPYTEEGVILGTVSYMSPEQAEGRPVDARSDIFALGSVLYEMITGRKAFQGETTVSTLTAILRDEPKRASEIVEGLPREVEQVISRCLQKESSRRFQHMENVKVVLEELKEELESGKLLAPPPVAQQKRSWNLIWVAGLMALLLCVVVTMWFVQSLPRRAPQPELVAVPLTSYPGIEDFPTFSPDGRQVAFMWNGPSQDNFDIYVKLVGPGPPPLRLTSDPAADSSPAWSPDGRSIAFLRELSEGRFAVLMVPPIGGPERKLAEVFQSPREAGWRYLGWSPDGRSLAVMDQEAPGKPAGVSLLSVETSEKRRLTSPPLGSSDYTPAFSPDGRFLAFARVKGTNTPDILLLPLSSSFQPQGEPKLLASPRSAFFGIAWTLDGREIIISAGSRGSSGSLWRIAADGSSNPERLAFTGEDSANPSLSREGNRLAYSRGISDYNIWRLELAGTERKAGQPARFISSTRREDSAEFSPDGKKIAFYSTRSGNAEIWVCNSDGTSAVQVTALGGPSCGTPRWSPDGEQIAFDSNLEGHWDIFVVAAGGGKPRRLTNQPSFESVPSWSRDGKWVYFCSDRSGERQIWKAPAQGGEAVQVTPKGGLMAVESPDGKSVYYTKSEEGKEGLWRVPLAGGEETQTIGSLIANRAFSVTVDGIYFITGTGPYTIEFFSFRTQQHKPLAQAGKSRHLPVHDGFSRRQIDLVDSK